MTFAFEQAEPVGDAVRRIVGEQVEGALAELRAPPEGLDQAVHSARKGFKRIRAVLRLVRGELGEDLYQRENVAYRDAGRRLAAVRDARVLLDTLDQLSDGVPVTRGALAARDEQLRRGAPEAAEQACAELVAARARIAEWPLRHDGFDALQPGIDRIYGQGRRRRDRAYARGEEVAFHEWRKRVKDLWHVLQLLEPSWPPVLGALVEQTHDLSDLLGDEHDLSVLAETVSGEDLGTAPERAAIAAFADGRRAELRGNARLLGARLYAEQPGDFAARLRIYWEAWRS